MKKKRSSQNESYSVQGNIMSELEEKSKAALDVLNDEKEKLNDLYERITEAEDPCLYSEETEEKLKELRRSSLNLKKAYQKCLGYTDELNARWKDISKGKRRRLIPAAPANAVIDLQEMKSHHFASGLNIYKILLICYCGSFLGVIIEMMWCLIRNGYIESRAGLVYGPFNLLYGLGAVALSAALYRYRNKGSWLSFLGGMVIGSVVEYLCSYLQELAFGSRSWDYSHLPFNINGRICLMYSVFWGVLGVLWIKSLYPRFAKMILRIPNKWGKVITYILTVFFIINATVTLIAVIRWSQRIDLIPAEDPFLEFIDQRFTDARMEKIFANMIF